MAAWRRERQPQPPQPPQRRFPVPLFFFLLLLLLPVGSSGGKYSREANAGGPEERAPPPVEFRLLRLNQVWEKAQRLPLSATRLAELHGDLRLQEKDELRWKKRKAEGGRLGQEDQEEEEEEEEARLRRNLHVILAKYGMNGKKDAPPGATNYIKDGLEEDGFLGDPRLEKLWNKAKASGRFSDEELEKLWREFKHHKEKVHEYNILLETVSRTEDSHKNMISPTEEEEGPWKVERLHKKHSELKEKLHSINQGFERLRRVSHQGFDLTSEFEEPRVIDLWEMAKSTNFTEEELASLRVKKHLQDLSGRISRGLQHNEL